VDEEVRTATVLAFSWLLLLLFSSWPDGFCESLMAR
jgi:hypothetical protein